MPSDYVKTCDCPEFPDNGALPTYDNCCIHDPETMFLPCLVGMPGMKGAPLPFPIKYLRMVSRRIAEMSGATPQLHRQKLKYLPPARTGIEGAHWLTNPGSVVPIDYIPKPHETEDNHVDKVVDVLPQHERVALMKSLMRYDDSGGDTE